MKTVLLDFEGFTCNSITNLRLSILKEFNSFNVVENDNRIRKQIDSNDIVLITSIVSCVTNLVMLYLQLCMKRTSDSEQQLNKSIFSIRSKFSPYLDEESLDRIEASLRAEKFPLIFNLTIDGFIYKYEILRSENSYMLRGRFINR